ncbi:hypothetical protein LA5095_06295 [Roseibium album]|uniref:Uncharacterized protein n=1 Tax=Roseibium album TaxID=311410 RepID=A0A0M7AYK1_9HYPH|nr:hypothetical protein LA5094_06265 [Roseibium album]CTQ79506.1 hypothetical protein LA5096_06227 [Roseibium album]CTQ81053.1 hypothetical protein LA5095_06295 [Roseibium album]
MSSVADTSSWAYLVRRPPTSEILDYLLAQWLEYEAGYSGVGQPFSDRSEPELTEGLGAYLSKKYDSGAQPFDGEFFAELSRVDLAPDGKRRIIGRSDIEWRLHGLPNFVVEFKVIGRGRPAKAYVTDGMTRFVDGRYGHRSAEGAMWAFFRPGSSELPADVEAIIDKHHEALRCQSENGSLRIAPSAIAPAAASFDSIHDRTPIAPRIRLAHIFVEIAKVKSSESETS